MHCKQSAMWLVHAITTPENASQFPRQEAHLVTITIQLLNSMCAMLASAQVRIFVPPGALAQHTRTSAIWQANAILKMVHAVMNSSQLDLRAMMATRKQLMMCALQACVLADHGVRMLSALPLPLRAIQKAHVMRTLASASMDFSQAPMDVMMAVT
jgi:hypothetical protein